jgi:hypothetical protein
MVPFGKTRETGTPRQPRRGIGGGKGGILEGNHTVPFGEREGGVLVGNRMVLFVVFKIIIVI